MESILAQQSEAAAGSLVEAAVFFLTAALVVLSAWAIVISQNVVRMAVYLLLTLAGVAGFYFMLHAEFLAAVQLVVYAGGTLILIIFGVMLTSKNPSMQLKTALWERMLAIGLATVILALMVTAKVTTVMPVAQGDGYTGQGHDHVALIGRALLSSYLVPFEVAGVLLLLVMIGAAFMARKRAA